MQRSVIREINIPDFITIDPGYIYFPRGHKKSAHPTTDVPLPE